MWTKRRTKASKADQPNQRRTARKVNVSKVVRDGNSYSKDAVTLQASCCDRLIELVVDERQDISGQWKSRFARYSRADLAS